MTRIAFNDLSLKYESLNMEQGSIINATETIRHVANAIVHQSVMRSRYGSITLFAIDDEESITEHKSSSDEFIYVIDGIVELMLDEVPILLKKGESQHITPNTLHYAHNYS